jgi:hypothetical protein
LDRERPGPLAIDTLQIAIEMPFGPLEQAISTSPFLKGRRCWTDLPSPWRSSRQVFQGSSPRLRRQVSHHLLWD